MHKYSYVIIASVYKGMNSLLLLLFTNMLTMTRMCIHTCHYHAMSLLSAKLTISSCFVLWLTCNESKDPFGMFNKIFLEI